MLAPVAVQGISVPEVSVRSSTHHGASPPSLGLIDQLKRAVRSVVLAAGVAVNCTVCAVAVVALATALSGLVGWIMSSPCQTLKRRVA